MSEVKLHPIIWEISNISKQTQEASCNGEKIGYVSEIVNLKGNNKHFFIAGITYHGFDIKERFNEIETAKETVEKVFNQFINKFIVQ